MSLYKHHQEQQNQMNILLWTQVYAWATATRKYSNKELVLIWDPVQPQEIKHNVHNYYGRVNAITVTNYYKLQAGSQHLRSSLVKACLNDASELMELMSQSNEFHKAVVEGKNEYLKLFVLAKLMVQTADKY